MANQEQGGNTAPRFITPHKGGRTERFYGRCTPQVKEMEKEIKRRTGKTAADLFEEIVMLKYREYLDKKRRLTPDEKGAIVKR